jgi:hypothetical protein
MARVDADDVKQIIDLDSSITDPEIDAFIQGANLVVTAKLGSVTVLSAALLTEIERWLAAHFLAIRDPRVKEEKIGETSVRYALGKDGMGLEATPYGQQVLLLDISGTMASAGKRATKLEVLQ